MGRRNLIVLVCLHNLGLPQQQLSVRAYKTEFIVCACTYLAICWMGSSVTRHCEMGCVEEKCEIEKKSGSGNNYIHRV